METMMKNILYVLPALLVTLLVGCSSTPSTPAPEGLEQSGSWVVREDQVMRVAAGAAGRGTLVYQGWQYPFTFEGAKITITGTDDGDIEGEVYNLKTLTDFEGTYTPKPELNQANEVTGFWGRNNKGAVLHMKVQGKGYAIDLEAKGATITLVKQ
jgi:hypothetical protein